MAKVLEIRVLVVYSPLDDALGSKAKLRTAEDTAYTASAEVLKRIGRNIPEGSACSLVIASKTLNEFSEE